MHAFFERLARLMAILGGLVLSILILITCFSVLGRSLNSLLHSDFFQSNAHELAARLLAWGIGPINGDFELVEAGMAFAVFAFLPLCQLHGAHASVDIFTTRLSPRADRVLRATTELVFAGVLVLVAWQLMQGMQSKLQSGQTTFLLELPVWWAYALSLCGAVVAGLVAIYLAAQRVREMMSGADILPARQETGL